jgi:ribosomal protein S12 methylthiotransferase
MACSFCSIPRIRGPYRSRPIASIVKEAETYREMGFSELNLISQNSSYFGKDIARKQLLPDLLQAISRIGFPWVRVFYLMPEEVTDEIVESFALPSVIPYFDLPFQHVSPVVLKAMKRGGSFQRNLELIERIRKRYDQPVIRSTFITGFPGEGEREFEELLRFARTSGIERIGVFRFSAEEGTEAFSLKSQIAEAISEKRKTILMNVSDQNLKKYNRSLVHSEQEFLPLGPWKNDSTIGRIRTQSPEIDGLTEVNRKFDDSYKIFRIRITRFQNEMLYGEKIGD